MGVKSSCRSVFGSKFCCCFGFRIGSVKAEPKMIVVPEFPSWTLLLIVLIVFAVALVI